MNVISSLIRTYFLDVSLDVFFTKVQNTISCGLRNLNDAQNGGGSKVDPSDIYIGMTFSRIRGIKSHHGLISEFFGCKIITLDLLGRWVEFSYTSAIDIWDDGEPEIESIPGEEDSDLDDYEYYP